MIKVGYAARVAVILLILLAVYVMYGSKLRQLRRQWVIVLRRNCGLGDGAAAASSAAGPLGRISDVTGGTSRTSSEGAARRTSSGPADDHDHQM